MVEVLRLRDGPVSEAEPVSLDSFLEESDGGAVRIEAGDDAERLFPVLDRLQLVEIDFPRFRDGRGFSSARMLREAGYRGEIRATGDVLVDLVWFMQRCGFDSFAPDVPLDPDEVDAALARYPHVYQPAADDLPPIWSLRHRHG